MDVQYVLHDPFASQRMLSLGVDSVYQDRRWVDIFT